MPRPFFVFGLVATAFASANAQDPVRPWLDWRTIQTPNYRFHFPSELETWTRAVAARVESIDSAITRLVGYPPPRPVHVVVDDPFRVSNGYVLPFIDHPVSVWWATPADPRSQIGNYQSWAEMLAVHELTHIAHMTRPSRNRLQRQLWASLSANLGPITRKAPRWVYEGYATMIEGRITGAGRPNSVWRPAILRQWGIEGRLPTYAQLTAWDDFSGGGFAYMGGSAFLEWLAARQGAGDSSLVHVWRRLTARRVRSFEGSFAGVFGDGPSLLYGRHVAELTRDAMTAKAQLERAGLVEGELVQRLMWGTGDPAISPNGERVAVTLRERDRPSRIVIWKTIPEPEDTAALRKRLEDLKKDPEDVPDRRIYPLPKKAEKSLLAHNGRSYQFPRWFADNKRVLVTRWAPRGDGTLAPDLYAWNTDNGAVRRLTRGAGLLQADPHPTLNEAIAMRCHRGRCDVVRVDLARGAVTTLLEGDTERSYYRPRYSPDGTRFVASVSDSGRWRIVVADRDGRHATLVGPNDGANRYDAQWLLQGPRASGVERVGGVGGGGVGGGATGSDSLVVVSERGGVPNLELLSIASGMVQSLTRVTGAALGPDVNPRDRSIWFLSLHSRGLDVRRLVRSATIADSAVTVTAERFGFAGVQTAPAMQLNAHAVAATQSYGAGPRHQRWFPGAHYSSDGAGGIVTIYSGDIVGRFDATVAGAYGQTGTAQGGSLRAAWRYPRPTIEFGAHGVIHEPSLGRFGRMVLDSLDGSLTQAVLAASAQRQGDGWSVRGRVGGGAGRLSPRLGGVTHNRTLGFADVEFRFLQSRGARGLVERLRFHGTRGDTRASYQRALGSVEIATTGRDMLPLQLAATFGRVFGTPHPFELLTVGGASPSIADSSLTSQRYSMPMFPTGIAVGENLLAWRIALPSDWTLFYEGASVAADPSAFRKWNRAVGMDARFGLPPVPVAFAPGAQFRTGVAYTLDAPFKNRVRAFLEMRMEP